MILNEFVRIPEYNAEELAQSASMQSWMNANLGSQAVIRVTLLNWRQRRLPQDHLFYPRIRLIELHTYVLERKMIN